LVSDIFKRGRKEGGEKERGEVRLFPRFHDREVGVKNENHENVKKERDTLSLLCVCVCVCVCVRVRVRLCKARERKE